MLGLSLGLKAKKILGIGHALELEAHCQIPAYMTKPRIQDYCIARFTAQLSLVLIAPTH